MSTEELIMDYLKKIEYEEDNRIAVKPCGDDEIINLKFGKKIAEVFRNYDPSLDVSLKNPSFDVYISDGTTYSIIIVTRLSDTEPRLKSPLPSISLKDCAAQITPYIEIDENTYEILCIDNGWKHSCYNLLKNINEQNKELENNYEKFKNIIVNFRW